MDFISAFERPGALAAASLSLSAPGVATALARVFYEPGRCDGAGLPEPAAAPLPANDRHPRAAFGAGRRSLLRVIGC